MKKIVFAVLVAIFSMQANAQGSYQKSYVPLSECYDDPFFYIEVNYVYLKDKHIGQRVFDFAKQFELPVRPSQVGPRVYIMNEGRNGQLAGYYIGFNLDFYYGDFNYRIAVELNPPYTNHEEDPGSPLYYMSDEEVSWDTYSNLLFRHNTIKNIWVHKKRRSDKEYVTETYLHHRDRYGFDENYMRFWLSQP